MLPATELLMQRFGERLQLARRRRRLTARQMAERAGMTVVTLRNLERGSSGVSMGAYLSVMQVLGLENELDLIAAADGAGRAIQDASLSKAALSAARARQATASSAKRPQRSSVHESPAQDGIVGTKVGKGPVEPDDVVGTEELTALLELTPASPAQRSS